MVDFEQFRNTKMEIDGYPHQPSVNDFLVQFFLLAERLTDKQNAHGNILWGDYREQTGETDTRNIIDTLWRSIHGFMSVAQKFPGEIEQENGLKIAETIPALASALMRFGAFLGKRGKQFQEEDLVNIGFKKESEYTPEEERAQNEYGAVTSLQREVDYFVAGLAEFSRVFKQHFSEVLRAQQGRGR